jgi:hypothetical protein
MNFFPQSETTECGGHSRIMKEIAIIGTENVQDFF